MKNTKQLSLTPKPTGYILWSQKVPVGTRQAAWHDVSEYDVPVVGKYDAIKVEKLLHRKFSHGGNIPGSSWGSCSVSVGEFNPSTNMVRVALSYGIGD